MSSIIAIKELPEQLRNIARNRSPKRKVILYVAESAERVHLGWSGGSRTYQSFTNLNGEHHDPAWVGDRYQLPDGVVEIQGGVFQGKPATLVLTINRATAEKLGVNL